MTARKRFKQRVRARAAKTGESYAVARRHLERRPGQEPNVPKFTTVTNTLHGFTVDLPEGWREVPPDALATSWQVAAFNARGSSRAGAAVLVSPASNHTDADIDPTEAELARLIGAATHAAYEAQGGTPSGGPEIFAGGDGYRVEARRRAGNAEVTVVDHIVVSGDRVYRLVLSTHDIDHDRAPLTEVAESFRVIEATAPLPDAVPRPALTDRARKVLAFAGAASAEDHLAPTTAHLLYGLAAEGEGVAAVVLREAGVDADAIKAALPGGEGDGSETSGTDGSDLRQLVTEAAPSIARDLGHYYIGTEHLLLALLRSDNRGSSLAHALGVDFAAVRSRVAQLLTDHVNRQVTGVTSE